MNARRLRRFLVGAGAACALAAAAWIWLPADVPDFDAVRAQFTPSDGFLLDRNGAVVERERLDFGVRRGEWVALDEISPALREAIVAGEDQRFWQHGGVDWRGVGGALRDRALRRNARGASTITMQVAAQLEHLARPRDSFAAWSRKLREVRVAYGLERRWSKAQILEAYLNLLDYRGELQGIGAAAGVLAHKAPSGLSGAESAVLAALLPAPDESRESLVARACARERSRAAPVDCDAIQDAAERLLARRTTPSQSSSAEVGHRLGWISMLSSIGTVAAL